VTFGPRIFHADVLRFHFIRFSLFILFSLAVLKLRISFVSDELSPSSASSLKSGLIARAAAQAIRLREQHNSPPVTSWLHSLLRGATKIHTLDSVGTSLSATHSIPSLIPPLLFLFFEAREITNSYMLASKPDIRVSSHCFLLHASK